VVYGALWPVEIKAVLEVEELRRGWTSRSACKEAKTMMGVVSLVTVGSDVVLSRVVQEEEKGKEGCLARDASLVGTLAVAAREMGCEASSQRRTTRRIARGGGVYACVWWLLN